MQIEIQDYHRDQLEKAGISLPPREETVLTLSGNFTEKELDKAAKKGAKRQSSRSETIAAPSIENPLPDNALSKERAASDKPYQVTYRLNRDGSVLLRSLKGITDKKLKLMSDDDLKAINLFKTLIGKNFKFFPVDYPTTSAKTKTESKYTREKLEAMDRKEIAKVYRAVIPYSDRCNEKNTRAEYALKPFMIEAILKA